MLEREWRYVLYLLLTAFGFSILCSSISISDFSEMPRSDLKPFIVQNSKSDTNKQFSQQKETTQQSLTTYSYDYAVPFKRHIDLDRVDELSADQLKELILKSTPRALRGRLARYIDLALIYSQKHKVDPFWVIAVMWTESHFKNSAKSHVNARGLMQIMPATGHEISRKLRFAKTWNQTHQVLRRPRYNIEMGAYYLNRLMKRLWNNPTLATVAYNMGPNWVKSRIKRKKHVGNRNQYLNKVTRAYNRLTRSYVEYTKNTPRPFTQTFVALNRTTKKGNSDLIALNDISFL